MSDLELAEIRDDIKATKRKLALAEDAGNEALILMYGNTLTEQQKKENILLAGAGDLILYDSKLSSIHFLRRNIQ
jgi:hypothetical protein